MSAPVPSGVLLAALVTVALAGPASAGCLTGPIRVSIDGCEPGEAKVFFRRFDHDASGSPPQVHFFDLHGPRPARAVRAFSLEADSSAVWDDRLVPPAWRKLAPHLVALPAEARFELTVRGAAAPRGTVGVDSIPTFLLTVEIESAGGLRGQAVVAAACQPLVSVGSPYGIPGRPERLVILTYIGRAYGCEEVELPVLLR